ncbi:hypothetical protein WJX72_008809 [[Myrmecia] bisecta]|uniref:Uncharacterized protein n=1 Tax=[Myrmecia] bisecta TaxID=41462 RepID=A0AAW1P4Z9_9CHLO
MIETMLSSGVLDLQSLSDRDKRCLLSYTSVTEGHQAHLEADLSVLNRCKHALCLLSTPIRVKLPYKHV